MSASVSGASRLRTPSPDFTRSRRAARASASVASRSTGACSTSRLSYSTPRRERASLALAQVGQPFLL